MKTISIRLAQDKDFEGYCDLYLQVNTIHAEAHPEIFQPTRQAPTSREEYRDQLVDPLHCTWIALEEDQPVGFCHVILREAPPLTIMTPRRFVVVDTLSVDAAHRRQGIGRALMAEAERWAREQGAQAMDLSVYDFIHGAIGLYESLGYRSIHKRMSKSLK
jgi:GNAT superfamily N-acetyltransferase